MISRREFLKRSSEAGVALAVTGAGLRRGDITFGNKNILSMVAQAALLGQKGAYYHKWLVHRRLRPECFAGRIEVRLIRLTRRRTLRMRGHALRF